MMGWELSVATPFTSRQDSTENTTATCVLTVSLQVETYCQGPQCFGLQVSCSDTRHGWPQAPACSGTWHRPCRGGLHPSVTWGNASDPPAGEGTPLPCRRAEVDCPSGCGRCQHLQALPGSRDLLLLCQGRIFQKMCVGWKKLLSGKEQLGETSCGQHGAGRE